MELTRSAESQLLEAGLDTTAVAETLGRIAAAVPHLVFSRWRVSTEAADGGASPDTLGWSHYLGTGVLHLHIQLKETTIASEVTCRSMLGYVDKAFLEYLADEAARLFATSTTTAIDPTGFGLQSVASTLQEEHLREGQGVERALRYLRSLSSLTYENQRISYGVLIRARNLSAERPYLDKASSKRLRRLSDGVSTVVVLHHAGRVVGLAPLDEPSIKANDSQLLPRWLRPLAHATARGGAVGIALTRSGDILAVARGRLLFAFRSGKWFSWRPELLCAVARTLYQSRGQPSRVDKVVRRLMSCAVELSFRRSGGLFVIANSRLAVAKIVGSRRDRLRSPGRLPEDIQIDLSVSVGVLKLARSVLVDLGALDGAVVVDRSGDLHGYGVLVRSSGSRTQGARSRASEGASRHGMAIKISSDGMIEVIWRKVRHMHIG